MVQRIKKKADAKDDTKPELLKTTNFPDYAPKSHLNKHKIVRQD